MNVEDIIVEPIYNYESFDLNDLLYSYLNKYSNFNYNINNTHGRIIIEIIFKRDGFDFSESYNTLYNYSGVDIDLFIEKVKREYMIDKLLDI